MKRKIHITKHQPI